ncbi:O-antigen ligase family protein [Elioraea rosea]|uniref:O-antigen ligase family protein n=1 Tax=Elioraea rosea TaxID=2492390 RepID=UPI001182C43F|nr:O-antigen ligase family protein [Elioraea rosea]
MTRVSLPLAVIAAGLAAAMPVALIQNRGLVPLALIMALAAVPLLWLAGRGAWRRAAPLACAGLLALWAIASSLWAIEPSLALRGGVALAGLGAALGTVLLAMRPAAEVAPRAVLVALVATVGLGALLLLVELFAGAPLNNAVRGFPTPPRSPEGTKPAATLLALLTPPAILAVHRLWGGRAAAALGVLAAAAVLASTSEAARLALIAAIGAAGIAFAFPRLARRILPLALALAVLAGPLVLFQIAAGATRAGLLPLSAVHRTLIWDYAAKRAAERPLAGFGMDAARALPGGRDNPDAARLDRFEIRGPIRNFFLTAPRGAAELIPLHTHSMPLQIRLELGFLGLAIAVVFAFLCGRAVAGLPGRELLAAGAAVAASATVVSLLSYGAWQHWWWISVAFAAMPLALLSARGGR